MKFSYEAASVRPTPTLTAGSLRVSDTLTSASTSRKRNANYQAACIIDNEYTLTARDVTVYPALTQWCVHASNVLTLKVIMAAGARVKLITYIQLTG